MTVTNAGPATANGTTASLPLASAGFSNTSATPGQGIYYNAAGAWTIGSLASGATATLTVEGTAVSLGTIQITGTTTSDTFDPATGDNQSSTSVAVL
jgi:Domain of unknown function DUF11